MAVRGDAKIFFCVLLIAGFCTVSFAQKLIDCCLTVMDKPVAKGLIVDYREQISGMGCAIDATILVTRRNRQLCAPAKGQWVVRLKNHVVQQKKECKKRAYTGQNCVGVPRE
ncbi:C-C motif chemokine 19 Epstein-Barr virus-induced molecule 1 ligand chemokine [Channa argus]|uniref:C-C motif chemokine 19 Epstein-Barr virus-induced molecule 1 ligand chemokine n=2 Tax=Channa argus TaxID=215402 RepID=A0A6G1PZD7_CHAAH|nr:C-C motif chemokine 19 Epstein-Barr virus-induced molecule 1 ligand chemokine [Channa argus]KAK2901635.1 hypothetical protein Q8A73_011381 [Channa argus]